jgi:hypothetical protein
VSAQCEVPPVLIHAFIPTSKTLLNKLSARHFGLARIYHASDEASCPTDAITTGRNQRCLTLWRWHVESCHSIFSTHRLIQWPGPSPPQGRRGLPRQAHLSDCDCAPAVVPRLSGAKHSMLQPCPLCCQMRQLRRRAGRWHRLALRWGRRWPFLVPRAFAPCDF